MLCKTPYNPKRDIKAVEQTGFVDLAKANSMNALPSNLASNSLSYNGIDDPKAVVGRPSDIFEAAQASKVITDYVPPKKSE